MVVDGILRFSGQTKGGLRQQAEDIEDAVGMANEFQLSNAHRSFFVHTALQKVLGIQ